MANTETTTNGNGTAGPFPYYFPALEAEHVKVLVDNIEKTVGLDYSLDFTNKQITFLNTPYPTAAEVIRIYRDTDDDALVAEFYSGAAIRATDLNDNFNQALYISQEIKTLTVQASTGDLVDGSITSNLIASDAVTASKISNSSVTTAKLADGSVTATKLSASYLPTAGGTMTGVVTFNPQQTYPKVPQNAKTVAYTLLASDAGKHISITTGGVTIPSGVFGIGDVIEIYNNSSSNQTISQGGNVTLRLAGTASTGNRTLAQYGLCSVLCVAANTFVISGSGLT
jgi:hypothetical protein